MKHGTLGGNDRERFAGVNRHAGQSEEILLPNSERQPFSRRLITLAFLSETIPASLISERLARSLGAEVEAPVLLLRCETQERESAANNRPRPDVMLNGEFHMPPELRATANGFYSLTLGLNSEPPSAASIDSLINQLSRRFRHVLVAAPADARSAPWLFEFLLRSDLAYLFLQATTEDVYHLDVVIRELLARDGDERVRVKPIVCLGEGQHIDGFDVLVEQVASPAHWFVHGCPGVAGAKDAPQETEPTNLFDADIRRLAREIGGRLVGLALSSGAAKGYSHIGVIQVLEENGIEVDVVAGASIGGYIGALWTFGHDGKELERLARELESRWGFWSLLDPVFPPRQGFLRGFALRRRLMRSIGSARFADLPRPLRIVAGNLSTLDRATFASGEVAAAVHASMAVPGICVPVTIDGEAYIDGGIVDPLPVDILREMGAAHVIAVNAIPTPERLRYGFKADRELARLNDTPTRKLFRKVLPIDQQLNYFARGNLFEILMRSIHGAQVRLAEASCGLADLVLRPDICDDRWLDCRNPGRFIALGREVAERHLGEIKALVAQKEIPHERELAAEAMATIA